MAEGEESESYALRIGRVEMLLVLENLDTCYALGC